MEISLVKSCEALDIFNLDYQMVDKITEPQE